MYHNVLLRTLASAYSPHHCTYSQYSASTYLTSHSRHTQTHKHTHRKINFHTHHTLDSPPSHSHLSHTPTQDEPTSGVDPAARQFLWSVIRGVATAGQSVLITTHSMAECEALCSRVGIMVNGSFRCLGTPQQLKSRYGDGYRLKLRLSGGDLEPIQEFVRQNFPHSVLKVCQCSVLLHL